MAKRKKNYNISKHIKQKNKFQVYCKPKMKNKTLNMKKKNKDLSVGKNFLKQKKINHFKMTYLFIHQCARLYA